MTPAITSRYTTAVACIADALRSIISLVVRVLLASREWRAARNGYPVGTWDPESRHKVRGPLTSLPGAYSGSLASLQGQAVPVSTGVHRDHQPSRNPVRAFMLHCEEGAAGPRALSATGAPPLVRVEAAVQVAPPSRLT